MVASISSRGLLLASLLDLLLIGHAPYTLRHRPFALDLLSDRTIRIVDSLLSPTTHDKLSRPYQGYKLLET